MNRWRGLGLAASTRAGRIQLWALGAIVVATIVGLVALWPTGESEELLDQGLSAHTELGTVESVTEFACEGFQTDTCRRLAIRVESGPDEGEQVELELGAGALDPEVSVGDRVRLAPTQAPPEIGPEGQQIAPAPGPQGYSLADFERRAPLLILALAFAAIVVVFGRLRGALSLVGVLLSLLIVIAFIVPSILDGRPPLAVAIVGAAAVMLVTVTLAHGFGPMTIAAMLGTASAFTLTAILAAVFTSLANLTGLSSEEATILQANTGGISIQGLMLAGMVIGALGVLDDVTVSQSSTVFALRAANPALGLARLWALGVHVGRDHVAATVNTLVLAYVGSALPVLLIFGTATVGVTEAINLEIVAREVVATLVGSIGLVAAMPITTGLAALLARDMPADAVAAEAEHGHSH